MMKGIIALDIDGTLVTHHRPLSSPLISFLTTVERDGWVVFFATGRTIRWSMEHLSALPFPFFLAPYNGACIFSLPQHEMISSALMSFDDVVKLSPFISEFGAVVYEAGGEERIFYTADIFSQPILDHLRDRQERQQEQWAFIDSIESIPHIAVASIRFFLSPEAAQMLSATIARTTPFRAPTMKDSYHENLRIVQVTAQGASKGQALHILRAKYPRVQVIAAGDDMNDVDLIAEADFGIAMDSAPDALKKISKIIALSVGEDPIIGALQQSIKIMSTR